MYAKTEAEKETTNNQNLAVKDEFLVIKCSTCEAFSIEYRTYKGHKMVIQGTGIPEKTKTNIDSKDAGFWEFELDKSTIFPFTSSPENVPVIVQDDYKLMHLCYQVGSSQGLAVHCRRILEKIFSQFESKYLTKKEKIENRDIKE